MMNIVKARKVANAFVKLRNLATDEQACEVSVLYPEWKTEINYRVNERILYNDILYKVLVEHTSQEEWTPENAPSLFTKILIPESNHKYYLNQELEFL